MHMTEWDKKMQPSFKTSYKAKLKKWTTLSTRLFNKFESPNEVTVKFPSVNS